MILKTLRLRQFRNYTDAALTFDPGANLIVGRNAQGKTNLLEAIALLGSGKSFRTQRLAEAVRFGTEFAEAEGTLESQGREQTIRWLLFADSRQKRGELNGIRRKTAGEFAGILPAVLFCPEDLLILKTGSAQRRKFGDTALCQLRPNYDAALAEYNRLLERKSHILRDGRENSAVLEILPEYNARLCYVGAILISYRARFYDALGKAAGETHGLFSGGGEKFTLRYQTVSTVTDPFAPIHTLESQLHDHLNTHARAELESGQCLTGPHRDDFEINLSGVELKRFGSQGQTRTAAISLKLAQRELLRRELNQQPLLLLDDVLSELDKPRQEFVLNQLGQGQVFITCCDPNQLGGEGKVIEIEDGKVK